MKEKAKIKKDRHSAKWLKLKERAENDPERARMLEAIETVMERYSDTLQKLADS